MEILLTQHQVALDNPLQIFCCTGLGGEASRAPISRPAASGQKGPPFPAPPPRHPVLQDPGAAEHALLTAKLRCKVESRNPEPQSHSFLPLRFSGGKNLLKSSQEQVTLQDGSSAKGPRNVWMAVSSSADHGWLAEPSERKTLPFRFLFQRTCLNSFHLCHLIPFKCYFKRAAFLAIRVCISGGENHRNTM